MSKASPKHKTIEIDGKQRYYEPAPKGISAANFRKVVESRRSVRKFTDKTLRMPHMGFNGANADTANPLFETGIATPEDFYFVHSYCFVPDDAEHVLARTHYGDEFTSAVHRDNIFGVQFHPEKSQSSGLKLISRFIKLDAGGGGHG